jgi:hypothetical protein
VAGLELALGVLAQALLMRLHLFLAGGGMPFSPAAAVARIAALE